MDDRAERTWSALSEIFGASLTNSFGASVPPLWAAKIAALSDRQLEHGLRCMADWDSSYAPALGQFVAACKSGWQHGQKALPAPSVDHWDAALNRLLLSKIMRAQGVHRSRMETLVKYKREFAQQLRAAYGDGETLSVEDQIDIREMELGVSAHMDEIIGQGRRPETSAEYDVWAETDLRHDAARDQRARIASGEQKIYLG